MRLPKRISLNLLFLMVTVCCVVASRAAVWTEARRAVARFSDLADRIDSENVTCLDVALAAREAYLTMWNAPFANRESAAQTYEIALYYSFADMSQGPSDFRYKPAEALKRFLIDEYKGWWDQKFPDRRREEELEALLAKAVPAARLARQEWCQSQRSARIENRKSPK